MTPSHQSVSDRVLAETPANALKFLTTVGTSVPVHTALYAIGFKESDCEEGWTLLRSVPPSHTVTPNNEYADALRQLDTWQGPNFTRARAALTHLHPGLVDFVFADVVEGPGAAAVLAIGRFLSHLDELESGASRKHTRKSDHAALETLAVRGITKQVREHMAKLLAVVETVPATPLEIPKTDPRREALLKLHAWLTDWQECARSVITRRDLLIRLGIGKRRSSKAATPTPQPAPAATGPNQPAPQQAPSIAAIVRVQSGTGTRP